MKAWIGLAALMAALAFATPAAVAGSRAAPQTVATSDATEFSARRVYRRYPAYPAYPRYPSYPAYARYPSYPSYYARPYYYRPYPYTVPVPFFLGFGYLPYY